MGERVEEALGKCIRAMVKEGLSPKEAKSRCIGRFKNTGNLKKKGRGLKESKRKKFKLDKD